MNLNSLSLEQLLSFDTFKKYIIMSLSQIIAETGGKIQKSLKDRMKPPSKNYVRTGQTLNSFYNSARNVDVKVENGLISNICIFNVNIIVPKPSGTSYMFNHHMNWDETTEWRGNYVPYLVPEWLNDGFTVVGRDGSRHEWTGLHYYEAALGTDDALGYIQNLLDEYMDEYMNVIKIKLKQMKII